MSEIFSFSNKRTIVDEIKLIDDKYMIKIHRKGKYTICPDCGKETKSVHSFKERHVQDLPIQDKETQLIFKDCLFVCHPCKKRFIESLENGLPKAKRTNRLDDYILSIASSNSPLTSAAILNKSGVNIKKSCI